ncbi:MAG: PLP-dependent aminotransferase family protein [Patescibacteria group bacterium]|nr:PLP-dependent aminotransferase family protein [Patescibacteria group bacterium]
MANFINSIKSKGIQKIEKSAISEIIKVINRQEIISLAGGLPAPETFPKEIISLLSQKVIEKHWNTALQYGSNEGVILLRKIISDFLKEKGIKIKWENVGIVSGSQQALDFLTRIFINPKDNIAVEAPTYIGAIDAFSFYQPNFVEIQTDEEGAIPEKLEKILKNKKIKFIYLVTTFQNPTGKTMSKKRRIEIASVIKKYNTILIEDDPYGYLRYQGKHEKPIQTLIPEQTIYLSTFSKILAPGLRLGFYVANDEILKLIKSAKQTSDLHTSNFDQLIAYEYLKTGSFKKHLPKIINIYKKRQKTMLDALEKYFPKNFSWTKPEGGMFIWIEGPKNFNSLKTYWKAIENNVAYIPGQYFFVKPNQGENTMRLNFTNVTEEKIVLAIKKLSKIIKQNL